MFLQKILRTIPLILFSFVATYTSAQEEIIFSSAGTKLSGTLILPKGEGPFPAVIFIHGSGAEERGNSISRAKEFAQNGIAAFIYDKRGVGQSEGNKNFHQFYSFDTLAMDANAAADILSKRSDIKAGQIGFVAASQGGWVAPLAASLNKHISFMIISSGSVSTVGEDNLFERSARLRKEGFTEEEVKEAEEMHKVDKEVSRSGDRFDEFVKMWEQYKTARWFKRVYLSEQPSPVESKYRQWYKTVVDFDPVIYLQNSSIPVLWLYGDASLDGFCPVELSLKRLNELKRSGKKYEMISFQGADHSLQKKSKDL
jgi:pimeloyl-ACP methyl ester carboxylesterase